MRRRVEQRREAEVEDLHAAVAREEDVLGLEIAMDDAAGVRRRQAARDLQRDVERRVDGKRAGAEPRAQRLALEAFRHEVRGAGARRRRRRSGRWCD